MNDQSSEQPGEPGAETFQEGQAFDVPSEQSGAAFVVDLEGFEGPIDVLLSLARDHKLDITQISMVALADQYLAFVAEARRQNLELAADYLVMAAWLAYMKSRLLLPDLDGEDEPTGEEMAAALAFQLKRLQSMQDAGEQLMARRQLGIDFFRRGEPEIFRRTFNTVWDASLFDLLKAYGDQHRRKESGGPLHIEPFEMYTMEDALLRLRRLLGPVPEWRSLWAFLPEDLRSSLKLRSAVAATFAASLEMAREGYLKLQQSGTFGPIHIRPSKPSGQPANDDEAGNAQ